MKSAINIAMVYIGLVIGAGFASGREILEYFNVYSQTDFTGIIFASFAFGTVAFVIMKRALVRDLHTFGEYIDDLCGGFGIVVRVFMYAFMFCGFFVMLSGCGTLLNQTFGTSRYIGTFILAVICFAVFVFDIKGLVAINSVLVPFMVFGISLICINSILTDTALTFSGAETIYKNRLSQALCYVSYNTLTASAVLVPLCQNTNKKALLCGAAISGGILGILIFLAWSGINIYYDNLIYSEMPLLTLAEKYGEFYRYLYATVLFMSICTTAVSHGFGLISCFKPKNIRERAVLAAILCLVAIPLARFGFSSLIGNLYGLFGYIGIAWMLWIFVKGFKE